MGKKYTSRLLRVGFIEPFTFLTPFEIIDIIFTISIKDMVYYHEKTNKTFNIKVNLMDIPQEDISYMGKKLNLSYT